MDTEDVITAAEAATIIGVSTAQVNRYCASQKLPARPGKKRGRGYAYQIKRADVEAFQRPKRGPKPKSQLPKGED